MFEFEDTAPEARDLNLWHTACREQHKLANQFQAQNSAGEFFERFHLPSKIDGSHSRRENHAICVETRFR